MKTVYIKWCSVVVLGFMLSACGGGGSSSPAESTKTVINLTTMVDGMMAEDVSVDTYTAWNLDKFEIIDDMVDNVDADIALNTMIDNMVAEEAAKQ